MVLEPATISSTAARYSQIPSVASSVAQPRQIKRDPSPPLKGASASPSLKRLLGEPKVMDGPREAKRRKLEYAFKGSEFPLGRTRTENTEPAMKFQSVHEGRYEDFVGFRDRFKYKSRALPNLNHHNASGSNQHPSQDMSRPTVNFDGPLSCSEASLFTWDSPLFPWDSSFVPWQPQNSSTANRPKRIEDSGLNTPSSPPTSSNIDNLMSVREKIQRLSDLADERAPMYGQPSRSRKFEFGITVDPELALARRMSMEAEQERLKAERKERELGKKTWKLDRGAGASSVREQKPYRRRALDRALTNHNVSLGGIAVDYTISEDRTGDPGEEKRRCLAVLAERPGVLRLHADKASKDAVDRESARVPARKEISVEVNRRLVILDV
ncbi:hypothetical protein LTR72_000746 [Exophiala xenobiotica]|nr:hypothetical protein LTR92_009144 [Exophiala xenobiotica]KAK5231563.1 hypothetical protein LTR72_000746 [Exophiala xenobiotica]KAK5288433.1 hypothetical protein LTR14_008292 [Exophiala xenobiotica]KAK5476708.1 hypothetical protein LTR55_008762 [Exophiala xenobiotica]